jgi:hypothetical protein
VLLIVALPGIILLGLSILAVLVSVAALLLLAMPVYRVLSALSGSGMEAQDPLESFEQAAVGAVTQTSPQPRRHVDVTIIE